MGNPSVIVLAGPNGAGKTTASVGVIQETLGIAEFVNADVIAKGLSGFAPENAALQAGRIMLQRLQDLAEAGASFSFETTLASRSFAPWIGKLVADGYSFHLFFSGCHRRIWRLHASLSESDWADTSWTTRR